MIQRFTKGGGNPIIIKFYCTVKLSMQMNIENAGFSKKCNNLDKSFIILSFHKNHHHE